VIDLAHDSAEVRRRVAISAGAQGCARILNIVLNIATTLIIIRYLSPSSYGNYVMVLTASLLVGLVADFGLTKLATREVSARLESEGEVLGTILLARICLAVACVGLLQLVLVGLRASSILHLAGLIASLGFLGNALMVSMVACYVRIKQHYEAIIQTCMELLEAACLVVLVVRRAPHAWLFIPPALAAFVGGVAATLLVRRRFGTHFRLAVARIPYLLKEALPLGPALMISVCYLKIDTLLLVALKTSRDVGIYGSAYQPIEYLFLASAVVINVVFPLVAAAYAVGDFGRVSELYRRGAEILVAGLVLVPVLLSLIAVPLVSRVYGPAYDDAARPLQLLAVALVLMVLSGWQAFVLLAAGRQRATLVYDLGALGVAVCACSILIRAYGITGAALGALCTALFVFVCSSVVIRRYLAIHLALLPMTRILGAAGSLWVMMFALDRLGAPWPVVILAALVTYPALLGVFHVVRPSTLGLRTRGAHAPRQRGLLALRANNQAMTGLTTSAVDSPALGDLNHQELVTMATVEA
jgi:O-antigen/teichoic acid export membrane protein